MNSLKEVEARSINSTKIELSNVEVLGKGLSPKFLVKALRLDAGVAQNMCNTVTRKFVECYHLRESY